MPPHIIVLDVSGRKYKTQKATLEVSPYFQSLLKRWDDSDRQEDGSYFVDADPTVFQHILDFMRRPSKFPLFWTKETSFDYVLYNKLEAEADYFLLHDLRDWIREKCYLEAVKVVVEVKVMPEKIMKNCWIAGVGDVLEVQNIFGSYSEQKRFMCPRQLHENYRQCERDGWCEKVVMAHGQQYDDPPKRLTLVIKTMEFDETVCRRIVE
ncbi:hypothetical protein F5884DRAFT_837419 [Xylogone sp. PMI_703]|nr:hypothetical protein F5884DRAFT_837419 [Xylogone sp. PMI_703]